MALILSGDTGVPASGMPTGSVIQTVSTNKSDTFTSSAQSFSDITGLSVSITPTSATSKILVILDMVGSGVFNSNVAQFRIVRDSTVIDAGNAAGGRSLGIASTITSNNVSPINIGANFLDSPATTSPLTYKVQCRTSAGVTLYVNLAPDDSDDINRIRTASTITVMEIKG
jgi:hypothetical protein